MAGFCCSAVRDALRIVSLSELRIQSNPGALGDGLGFLFGHGGLHKRVKATCAMEGLSMTEVVTEFLEQRFPKK